MKKYLLSAAIIGSFLSPANAMNWDNPLTMADYKPTEVRFADYVQPQPEPQPKTIVQMQKPSKKSKRGPNAPGKKQAHR